MHSLLIVVILAISPTIILFLADVIGRVLPSGKGKGGVNGPGEGGSGIAE
jgi:hypothetical protein